MRGIAIAAFFVLGSLAAGCGGSDEVVDRPDARVDDPIDAGGDEPDAGEVASVARGQYLVDHVGACIDCHTPRDKDGSLDLDNYLAGAECFIDIDPATDDFGCLHARNLTDHATGLANRSDAEIKAMFQDGVRPDGEALITVMPYWIFHNFTELDADSIVMYLRTVTGVDHAVPANEAPWAAPEDPAEPFDPSVLPAGDANGRYLATIACLECHTASTDPLDGSQLDGARLFAGGRAFPLGPPFGTVNTANLTPHATGLADHTAADIAAVLLQGTDPAGDLVCPPMPAGPMGAFGGLTADDAAAIAAYIDSLPAIENDFGPDACAIPAGP